MVNPRRNERKCERAVLLFDNQSNARHRHTPGEPSVVARRPFSFRAQLATGSTGAAESCSRSNCPS